MTDEYSANNQFETKNNQVRIGMDGRGRGARRVPRANKPEVIHERGQIIGRYKAGQSLSQISREMGLSRNTVKLWVQRYEAEGHVMTRMRPGRPRLTTPEQDAMIVAAAHESPLTTAIQITR
ncbi:hypothetical protein Pcinc_008295 [Petrolisthes cinctipes]|uniref:Transposase n=1 Tax=Petrolisthes cinctipes TaxID=88211 RepID=A0AAE1G953_PETCI|nr:hypothetical protein Pcinc_008295 [Petrolisthes cinctipes]